MMKINHLIFFCLAILLISITGCKQNDITDDIPDLGIDMKEANRDLKIYSPRGFNNSFTNGDILTLLVKNSSNDSIVFPSNYNMRLFIYQENKWIEIGNNFNYSENPDMKFIFPPSKNDFLLEGVISAAPYEPTLKETVPLKVIIVGNMMKNRETTDERSIGIFDFILKP